MITPTETGALSAITELGNVIAALRLDLAQALQDCKDYDTELRAIKRSRPPRTTTWDDVAALMDRTGVRRISKDGAQWWAVAGMKYREGATLAEAAYAAGAATLATESTAATQEAQP